MANWLTINENDVSAINCQKKKKTISIQTYKLMRVGKVLLKVLKRIKTVPIQKFVYKNVSKVQISSA